MNAVKREGNKVWIDGLTTPPWGNWDENSVMCCLSVVMPFLGEKQATYDFLMGISGAAFRLQAGDAWCPSSPHALVGYNCAQVAVDAFGFPFTQMKAEQGDTAAHDKRRAALVDSINRGRPCLYDPEECCIIFGYENEGETFLIIQWQCSAEKPRPLTDFRWGSGDILGDQRDPLPREQMIRESLERAVMLATTTEKFGGNYSGFLAYEKWIAGLLADDNENVVKGHIMGNGWIYCCLAHCRGIAAQYLDGIADEVDSAARSAVTHAADQYRKVREALGVPCDVAPGPWSIKPEQWTRAMRERQAKALTQALAHERQAIAAIADVAQPA